MAGAIEPPQKLQPDKLTAGEEVAALPVAAAERLQRSLLGPSEGKGCGVDWSSHGFVLSVWDSGELGAYGPCSLDAEIRCASALTATTHKSTQNPYNGPDLSAPHRGDGEHQRMAPDQFPTFGSLLRRYRRAAHLTQEQLAERAGYHPNYVGMLERGVRSPAPATIDLLADVLALDASDRTTLHSTASQSEVGLPGSPGHGGPTPPGQALRHLPPELTSLVGREREEAEVVRLLRSEGVRLLTLTGTGGVGKTRLALRVAASLAVDFADGVIFVPLAATREPALVASAVAGALGLREMGEQSLQEQLTAYLADKQLLLLLDNFEHVIEAASLVTELLVAAPQVKALVTSRAPLRLTGEQEYAVPPLALPPAGEVRAGEDLARYAAVMLFVQRARSVQPSFGVDGSQAPMLGEICRRLDGLPLAIELAAARVKVLPLPALRERLEHRLQLLTGGPRDLPQRQQTMRDTIAWSHDLLDEGEQRLFRRLAVFVGGCGLRAAEAVCTPDGSYSPEVLDILGSLVDKGLLISEDDKGEPRFRMLETIREFAGERLEASGEEEAIRRHHADFFLTMAEEGEVQLRGPDRARWRTILEREHDNLRAALGWSVTSGDAELGLRLAGALAPFWYAHGYANEGRNWFEVLLPVASDVPPSVRARALLGAGGWIVSDNKRGVDLLQESLSLYRELGDDHGIVPALVLLSLRQLNQGDVEQATVAGEEALRRARTLDGGAYLSWVLSTLGAAAIRLRRFEEAEALIMEGLALARKVGDVRSIARTISQLALIASLRSDFGRAAELAEEGLALYRELADTEGVAFALFTVAQAALGIGDFERARTRAEESLILWERTGYIGSGGLWSLEHLASVEASSGCPLRAARLWGAGEAFREVANEPLSPAAGPRYGEYQALARSQTDEATWAAAWQEGRRMTLDQAVAFALNGPSNR